MRTGTGKTAGESSLKPVDRVDRAGTGKIDSDGRRPRSPVPPPPNRTAPNGDGPTTKRELPDLSTGRPRPPAPPPTRDLDPGDGLDRDTIIVNGDVFVNNGTVNHWNGGWWYPPACGWSPAWNWCGRPWRNTWGGWSPGWSLGFSFSSYGYAFSLGYSSGWTSCGWPAPGYGWDGWYSPWWSTSISVVNCGWYPRIPCWNPCGPWWSGYAWSPYLAWAPYSTVVAVTVPVEPATVTVAPLAPIAPMGAVESEAWALLSEGFPETAAGLFASLHDDRPGDPRPLAGYAIALANLGDSAGAAATLRRALAIDPTILGGLPISPGLAGRLQSLESAARVTTRQAAATADAYFLLACWRTMLGRSTEAHFAATLAVEKGDGSAGTARLRDWLANVG